MKLTSKKLIRLIEQQIDDFKNKEQNEKLALLLSGDASDIIQGMELAYTLGLSVEETPFDKMDLSRENVPDYSDLLDIADLVIELHSDEIVSYLRKHLINAMEKGLRRRLDMGMTTGLEHPAQKIRTIIKNELTAHQRPINVIGV